METNCRFVYGHASGMPGKISRKKTCPETEEKSNYIILLCVGDYPEWIKRSSVIYSIPNSYLTLLFFLLISTTFYSHISYENHLPFSPEKFLLIAAETFNTSVEV
jgi:hypothetical protein